MGLGCKIVPTAEPLTQAKDCTSPLLFESPTAVETEDNVSMGEQNLQKEAKQDVSLREKHVEERELQLMREQEWKEWKERVEEEITQDLSIMEHNRQHLVEWEEQLRDLQEEDERQENQWTEWQQKLRKDLTKVQKERDELQDQVLIMREVQEMHQQCQQKDDHAEHLQQCINNSKYEMESVQKVLQDRNSQLEQLRRQHQESNNNLQQLQEKAERDHLAEQQLEKKLHEEQHKVQQLEQLRERSTLSDDLQHRMEAMQKAEKDRQAQQQVEREQLRQEQQKMQQLKQQLREKSEQTCDKTG